MDLGAGLKGQRLLITGGSSGLGAHFAKLAARNGASIAVAARRKDRLEALVDVLKELGAPEAVAIGLDVSDGAAIHACVRDAVSALGGLDVLVNNAGTVRNGLANRPNGGRLRCCHVGQPARGLADGGCRRAPLA